MYIEYEYIQPKKIICKLGDIGDKAYLVLDGEVDIFTKQSRHIQLTKYNYLRYLGSLLQYEEYGLLFSTLKDNYKSIPIEIVYVNDYEHANLKKEDYLWRYEGSCFAMSSKEIVFSVSELIRLNGGNKCNDIYSIDNIESYIKRIEPCLDNKNDIVLNVVIYTYIHLTSKKNGELIGEHAVSSKSTRCATLISRKPCHIGLISKSLYDITLKKCIETIKRKNISFLQSFSIFNNINSNILSTKYYNNFLRQTLNKSTYIIKQSFPIERIYMIKSGLFHITFRGSLLELIELKYEYKVKQMKHLLSSNSNSHSSLQWYIEKVNGNKKKDLTYYKRILHDCPSFNDMFYKRNVFLLSQAVSPDIIGFSDYVSDVNYKSYFNVQCVSAKGDVLTLHNSCFNEIKTDNNVVKDLEVELHGQRLSQMLERIELVIKTKMKLFTNENLSVKNTPIEQDNAHVKVNTKKINSFTFHPDVMHYFANKHSASKSKPLILNLLYKQSTSDLHCVKHNNRHNMTSNSKDNINNNSINNPITNTNATFCSFTKPRLTKTNSFTNSNINTTVSNSATTNNKSRNTSLFTKHKQSQTKIITPFYTSNTNSETNSTSVSKSKRLYRSSNNHKPTSPFCLAIKTHVEDTCHHMPLLYIQSHHKCVYNNTLVGNSHKYVRTNQELRNMGLLQGTRHQTVKPTSVSIEKYYVSKRKSFVLKRNDEHRKRSLLLKCKYYFSKETI